MARDLEGEGRGEVSGGYQPKAGGVLGPPPTSGSAVQNPPTAQWLGIVQVVVRSKEPTAEEALEWLGRSHLILDCTLSNLVCDEQKVISEGSTPLEAIRNAMKGGC